KAKTSPKLLLRIFIKVRSKSLPVEADVLSGKCAGGYSAEIPVRNLPPGSFFAPIATPRWADSRNFSYDV
ncbi:MAG: hypothetical protein Q4F08_04535, partial [Rikenellaceae bacterium]|nr:hypothetical protein [Rikenellaceae bacterium]